MKFIIMLFLLIGCTNLEFVYQQDKKNPLSRSTSFLVTGDQTEVASNELSRILGTNLDNNFFLVINVKEAISSEVISEDSTTLKYNVSHELLYTLSRKTNGNSDCILIEKKMTSTSNYDSKSAGYNFGTDISKTRTIEDNITNNIQNFVSSVYSLTDFKSCKNEG